MNQLLDNFSGKNHPLFTSNAQACQFADYFSAKIEPIYSDMPYQNCNTLDIDINVVKSRVLPNLEGLNHYLLLV